MSDINLSEIEKNNIKKFEKRLKKEIIINKKCNDFKFIENGNIWTFEFTVKDGIYKGQTHIIEMKLIYGVSPDILMYPINAPLCRFITKIWHPNVSEVGTICLDLLKDQWSIIMRTSNIIDAINVLLLNPNIDSPQNKAASIMIKNTREYKKKVKSFYKNEPVKKIISYTFK